MSDHGAARSTGGAAAGWAPASPRAWRCGRAWVYLLVCVAIGLAADLGSKWAVFEHLADRPVRLELDRVLEIKDTLGPGRVRVAIEEQLGGPPPSRTVVPGVLNFTLVLNPGAVFGTGAGGRWYFVYFTLGAMAAAVALFAVGTRANQRWLHLGIAMIVAGGLGNLYDRVFVGCVRDFIQLLPGVRWPFGWDPMSAGGEIWPYVSNVADKLLIAGVIVTAFCITATPKPAEGADTKRPAAQPGDGPSGDSPTPPAPAAPASTPPAPPAGGSVGTDAGAAAPSEKHP